MGWGYWSEHINMSIFFFLIQLLLILTDVSFTFLHKVYIFSAKAYTKLEEGVVCHCTGQCCSGSHCSSAKKAGKKTKTGSKSKGRPKDRGST